MVLLIEHRFFKVLDREILWLFELFTFLTFETLTVTNPILVYLRCKNKLLFLLRSFEVSLENCIFSCNVIWQVLKWILFLKSFLLFQFRLVRAKKNKYCQRAFLVLLIFCSSKGSVNRKIVLTRKKIIYILIFSRKKGFWEQSQKPHVSPHPLVKHTDTHKLSLINPHQEK